MTIVFILDSLVLPYNPLVLEPGPFLSSSTGITMHALLVSLLATIPLGTLVGAHRTVTRSRHRNVARQSTSVNKTYVLEDFYQAEDFFTYVSVLVVPHVI